MAANPQAAAYATLVAPLIPVFLLAAIATSNRFEATDSGKRRAFTHLVLTAVVVGLACLAEFVALFGVHQGALTDRDTATLNVLLILLALATIGLVVLPHIEQYVAIAAVPRGRMWRFFATIALATFVGLMVVIVSLE